MSELMCLLQDRQVASFLKRAFERHAAFQVQHDLPQELREKLKKLDQA